MNTDYGFFNLFVALDSVRKAKNKPVPTEPCSKGELPEIDYSLLRAVSAVGVIVAPTGADTNEIHGRVATPIAAVLASEAMSTTTGELSEAAESL